jgi:hypothetical protein
VVAVAAGHLELGKLAQVLEGWARRRK